MRLAALLVTLLCGGTALAATQCPPLPGAAPATPPLAEGVGWWELLAEPHGIAAWHGRLDDAPLGIGHLPLDDSGSNYHDWPRDLVLPLWTEPGGPFLAWVAGAQLHYADGSPARPLTGAGMVETGYEHLTFIVSATAGDGWLQLRVSPDADGMAWTHACHLGIGTTRLHYQPWEAFIAGHGDWLHFRNRVAHALRATPDLHGHRVTMVGIDHELEMLEMRGDWMRVRVRQPAWSCVGHDRPFPGRTDEGWVRWRDDATGPWTWIYSRGC